MDPVGGWGIVGRAERPEHSDGEDGHENRHRRYDTQAQHAAIPQLVAKPDVDLAIVDPEQRPQALHSALSGHGCATGALARQHGRVEHPLHRPGPGRGRAAGPAAQAEHAALREGEDLALRVTGHQARGEAVEVR